MQSETPTLCLILITVASAPTDLMAVQENSTAIRVSWTPPTPLRDTTGYIVYYSGGSSGRVNVTDGETDRYLLTDLQNGDSYNISIVGKSTHFFSERVFYPSSFPLSELLQPMYITSSSAPLTVIHFLSSRHAKCSGEFNSCSNHHHSLLEYSQWHSCQLCGKLEERHIRRVF